MNRRSLSRRTMLRGAIAGAGTVAIGLPLLDAMTHHHGTAHADGTPLPRRFALWFWGNGTHPGNWAPTQLGAGWTPRPLLAALGPLRSKVSIVSGTQLPVRGRNNPHVEGACGILTGTNPVLSPRYMGSANDWDFMTVGAPSIDELAADVLGPTRFRSIVLAVTPLHGVNGPGTAVRYISHRQPYLYNDPIFDPAALFQQLFGPMPPDPLRASVLDAVRDEARSLEGRVSAEDRRRLDAHLTALRELEQRVRAGTADQRCTPPAMPMTTTSYRARARIMGELVAMAFKCDLTRVLSMEFSSPASHASYPDVFSGPLIHNGMSTSFHEYEHSVGYDANVRAGLEYFVQVFADFLTTLERTVDGSATLLDSSLVLGTSEVSGGAAHTFTDFPLLVGGGARGAFRAGQHLRLMGENAGRVMYTCLRALGSAAPHWGSDQFRTSAPIRELLTAPM
jgi:hypothetical protein